MKTVILAGGFGTRISEESHIRPKPMIEIGGMPILWHIMKQYSHYGCSDFIICAGYKAYEIKKFFSDYHLHVSDLTFDLLNNTLINHSTVTDHWNVTVVDTGLTTMTGGRIKRIKKYIGNESFCLTYGDAVSDVNIDDLISYHKESKKLVTMTSYQPHGRFGALDIDNNDMITMFTEKKKDDSNWINAGFMVMEPEIFDMIEGDEMMLEEYPLEEAARRKQLSAFKHYGFWQCMDTLREKELLEKLWNTGAAPWKVWSDQ